MKVKRVCFAVVIAAFVLVGLARASWPTLPALDPALASRTPVSVLPAAATAMAFADRTPNAERARWVPAAGSAAGLAFKAEVPQRGRGSAEIDVRIVSAVSVRAGDVLLARLVARAPVARQESGEGAIQFSFQRTAPPNERSTILTLAPTAEWTTYDIPFTASHDFAPGEARVVLGLSDLAQTVEVSALEVLNFGNSVKLDQLPRTRFTYKGREADAAWRKAALERIEAIRTAVLSVRVVGANGQPLPGARVHAQLVQSEFVWGTSVNEALLASELPDSANYRRVLREFFNTAVIENGFKSPSWNSNPTRQAETLRAFDWLQREGFRQKGHSLVWPGWQFNTAAMRELAQRDPAAFKRQIEIDIRSKLDATRGRMMAWDVINEPIHERGFFAHLPADVEVEWFKIARELQPQTQLVINDYGMLNSARSPGTIALLRDHTNKLRRAGAPIDAIGIQGHVGQQPRAPESVLADLDLMAGEGLPIQITEFDINMSDAALQADYTRDFLIACYSHPALTAFIKWGFWESKHWKPDAAMFRKDWSEKPNAAVWREWVVKRWTTNAQVQTQADGRATVRGHHGRYLVTVTHGGLSARHEVVLARGGAEIVFPFP